MENGRKYDLARETDLVESRERFQAEGDRI